MTNAEVNAIIDDKLREIREIVIAHLRDITNAGANWEHADVEVAPDLPVGWDPGYLAYCGRIEMRIDLIEIKGGLLVRKLREVHHETYREYKDRSRAESFARLDASEYRESLEERLLELGEELPAKKEIAA